MWDGLERYTAMWFENLLIPESIPAMPGVQAKLEQGVLVADVGCGRGRALIKLAQTYLRSRYVGYDIFEADYRTGYRPCPGSGCRRPGALRASRRLHRACPNSYMM